MNIKIKIEKSFLQEMGFTFIEVMIAILIFVMAVLAAINITGGAVKATQEAREIAKATWLLQKVMVDLETKLETVGMDKGCVKKNEGKFESPNEKYRWITYCGELDLKLSQTAAQMMGKKDKDSNEPTKEDVMVKMVLDTAGTYMGKALREIHAEVHWQEGKQKRQLSLTTHFARYDLPLVIPGLGAGGSGGGSQDKAKEPGGK